MVVCTILKRCDELKKFNSRDSIGFALLLQEGILIGITTSENVAVICRRAEKLKLDLLESDCKDKVEVVKKTCNEKGIVPTSICYIGDDINNVELVRFVGYECAPADAIPQAKQLKFLLKLKAAKA